MNFYSAAGCYREVEYGIQPWVDKEDLLPGENWREKIERE